MLQEAGGSTERRRSRTYRAVGYTTALVLKTNWATGPMPLRDERSARRHRSSRLDSLAMHGVIFTSLRGYLLAVLLRGLAEGTSRHYGEHAEMEERTCMLRGDPARTF